MNLKVAAFLLTCIGFGMLALGINPFEEGTPYRASILPQ